MKVQLQFVHSRTPRLLLRAGAGLWTAFLFCAIASASAPSVPVLPEAAYSYGLIGAPWTIADLDGDQHPDLANSASAGVDIQGYLYRVEVQLSSGAVNGSFTVSTANRLGLNIMPRDVDGDHDLDLVITSGALRQPVGIWLNDGQGRFGRADSSLYPVPVQFEEISFVQPPIDYFCLLSTDEAQRVNLGIAPVTLRGPPVSVAGNTEVGSLVWYSFHFAGDTQPRAPPVLIHS